MKQLQDYGYKYFYVADLEIPRACRLPKPIGTICGYLMRLVTGVRYRVHSIEELEDRFYGGVLASKTAIDLNNVLQLQTPALPGRA